MINRGVQEGKKERPLIWQGILSGNFWMDFCTDTGHQIFGLFFNEFVRLHVKEGKQKCLLQLPFFILQGYYCCLSLAQGLVIKQKALLLALVMQLTWQLYLRA